MADLTTSTGIYRIKHLKSGKCYIGSAMRQTGFNGRWTKHKKDLSNNKHHSIKLQRAWNKYSKASFIFEVLEQIIRPDGIDDLEWKRLVLTREQHYLNTLLFASENDSRFDKLGYNICRIAGSTFGRRASKEARARMKANHADFKGINHPQYGTHRSKVTKQKLSKYHTGRCLSDESKQKCRDASLGESNPMAKLTVEDVLKIRSLLESGVSCATLANQFGLTKTSIYHIKNRKSWSHV